MNKSSITIIGNGAVAHHLDMALRDSADVHLVNSRTLENIPMDSILYIIAVKDSAIREVAQKLSRLKFKAPVVHTSGATRVTHLNALKLKHEIGVMYPLQTFSKGMVIDYSQIPFFIEAKNEETARTIRQICEKVSVNVFDIDYQTRKRVHLAAVFANNFVNAMIGAADNVLEKTPFDFSILMPLIKETIKKIEHNSPRDVQTGPAVREDFDSIETHRKILIDDNNKLLAKIYDNISHFIIKSKNTNQ